MSGLTINFAKSEVMVLGYSPSEAQRIANRLNCRLGSFPTTYLGLPISDNRLLEKRLLPYSCQAPTTDGALAREMAIQSR